MRKILLMAFTGFAIAASAQTWDNAFIAGGTNTQYGIGSARDDNQARIVVGAYEDGAATFGSTTLANTGGYDGFVAKYNSFNTFLWAARVSGPNNDIIKSVTTDPSGNIYACGTFVGSAAFYNASGAWFATMTTGSSTVDEGFIVKYNTSGTIQWIRRLLTTSATFDELLNIEYRNGTLAVLGKINTAGASAGSFSLPMGYYVAKLDPSAGTTTWAYTCIPNTNGSTHGITQKAGLCIDNNGNIYVTGTGQSGTAYGLSSSVALTTNTGAATMYAKYSNAGNLLWAKASQASASSPFVFGYASSITIDDNNNLYIAGRLSSTGLSFSGSLLFPAASGSLAVAVTAFTDACYIGKIDATNGNALWATRQVGFRSVDLAAGGCDMVYATLNTSYTGSGVAVTINGTGGTSYSATTNGGAHIVRFYTAGQLVSGTPWMVSPAWNETYLDYTATGTVDIAGTLFGTTSLPLNSGGSVTLNSATSEDVLAGTIRDNGDISAAVLSASASPVNVCAGASVTLSASATGPGGPFDFSWYIWNPATSTYIPGPFPINGPNNSFLTLAASYYNSYIVDLFGTDIVFAKVRIISCNGGMEEIDVAFSLKDPITYSQVLDQTICHNGNPPSPVFSVNAQNADSYTWQVSCNGGATWTNCSTNPSLYSGYNTASLTINHPPLSMDGCQFRCILEGGACADVTTTAATLHIVPTCFVAPGDGKGGTQRITAFNGNDIQVYPNPTSGKVTFNLEKLDQTNTLELRVVNMEGRVIAQQKIESSQTELDLSSFENGVYLYTISDNASVFNGRIVLTH